MGDLRATTDRVTVEKKNIPIVPQSMRTTIYHKGTGKPLEVFTVDAAEIVAGGEYERERGGGKPQEPATTTETVGTHTSEVLLSGLSSGPASAPASAVQAEDSRTKAELQDAVEAKGITVKSSATKADLLHLLELDTKTKSELQEMAEAKGLEAKGTKAELINLIAGAE